MPKELKFCNIIINDDFYLDFCFYFMNSLNKKADIRNYFCSFLSDLILKIENYENNLSPDIKIISKDLGIKEIIEKDNKKNKLMKIKTVDERQIMKTKKRIKEMINNSNNDLKRKINSNDQIPTKYKNESKTQNGLEKNSYTNKAEIEFFERLIKDLDNYFIELKKSQV